MPATASVQLVSFFCVVITCRVFQRECRHSLQSLRAICSAPGPPLCLAMAPRKKRGNDELWNHEELPVDASTLELSRDGKRVRWETAQVQPAAPLPPANLPTTAVEVPVYFAEDCSLPFHDDFPSQEQDGQSQVQDAPSDGPDALHGVKVLTKRYINSVSQLVQQSQFIIKHTSRTSLCCHSSRYVKSMSTNTCDATAEGTPTNLARVARKMPRRFVAGTALTRGCGVRPA